MGATGGAPFKKSPFTAHPPFPVATWLRDCTFQWFFFPSRAPNKHKREWQKHNSGVRAVEKGVGELRSLAAPTYHAAGGVQLSVRHTFEVLLAASVLFGAVAHGAKRRQQVLHRLKVGGHHGFFPAAGDQGKNTWSRGRSEARICFPAQVLELK